MIFNEHRLILLILQLGFARLVLVIKANIIEHIMYLIEFCINYVHNAVFQIGYINIHAVKIALHNANPYNRIA